MSQIPEDSITVRYSAKELFGRIDQKLDLITSQLHTKAPHEDVVALEARVTALEKVESERRGFGRAQKAMIALLVAIVTLLAPIAAHYLP